jgi:two-component system, NarL family, nitrate/nitrite response regulator NarL
MSTTQSDPIRILLIDDHVVVRAGLRMLIESWPGMQMIGEAGDSAGALTITAREKPDIILLDLDLGQGNSGLDILPELLSSVGQGRIIILTGVRDSEVHHHAVRLGAMGLVLKEKAAEDLRKAIEKVHDGEVWFDRSLTASIFARMSRANEAKKSDMEASKIASLTDREREVATLVGEGLKNKEIGERLFISETTVRHHLSSVFSKLDVSNRFELIIFLYRHKLIRPAQ